MSASAPLSQAMIDVLDERRRQVAIEGWTPEHDDQHDKGEMARAAAAYAVEGMPWGAGRKVSTLCDMLWPWAWSWWKPKDERRNKVRAAALLIADIERLDRAAAQEGR